MSGPALRALATLLVLLAGLALPATEAFAQSRLCRQLEAQLSRLGAGGGGTAQARRYDRAIDQQRVQLARGERQYRRAGCGGGMFWRDSGGDACDSIGRSLDRMERNLGDLERTRARMGGGGDSRRERQRIMAAIDANDCRVAPRERELPRVARGERRGLFDQLFGGGIRRAEPEEERIRRRDRGFEEFDGSARARTIIGGEGSIRTLEPEGGFGSGETYRTLCVRTCDGYYWPISYSSARSDFTRDEQNCQTMCPGTEVKLYSHRVPDEESENMIDLYGAPYTDLATAFKYRDASFVKQESCSCAAPKKNFSIVAGRAPDGSLPMSLPLEPPAPAPVAIPVPRPDPGSDPETLANRRGSFDGEAMRRLSQAKVAEGERTLSADRRVRVVGPAYLPDEAGAAGPQVPGPTAVQ